MSEVRVSHNTDEQRYGADYILAKNLIVFSHTEVERAHEGQGVGSPWPDMPLTMSETEARRK